MTAYLRNCTVCEAPITGRRDRKCCSEACRQALFRAKKAPGAVTSRAETVTTAQGSVTYSGWSADEPDDELGHWQSTEEPSWP